MFSAIQKWASFVRFSHTVFALPFALAAMMVAARDHRGWPGWRTFGLILAAMVCARTCAMAFNRIVDRKFDALNPRTAKRHLPTGQISLAGAILLWAISGAGLVVASRCLNPLCFYLSPAALAVICFYSLTKRFTDYTHVFLGLALALAPVGAWLAVKGVNVSVWEILQMTMLALAVVLSAAFLAHMVMCGLLLAFGLLCGFRIAFAVGWFLIVGCLVMEHWIARRRSLNWINLAFFRLNALVSAVFLIVVAAEVIFQGGFKLR